MPDTNSTGATGPVQKRERRPSRAPATDPKPDANACCANNSSEAGRGRRLDLRTDLDGAAAEFARSVPLSGHPRIGRLLPDEELAPWRLAHVRGAPRPGRHRCGAHSAGPPWDPRPEASENARPRNSDEAASRVRWVRAWGPDFPRRVQRHLSAPREVRGLEAYRRYSWAGEQRIWKELRERDDEACDCSATSWRSWHAKADCARASPAGPHTDYVSARARDSSRRRCQNRRKRPSTASGLDSRAFDSLPAASCGSPRLPARQLRLREVLRQQSCLRVCSSAFLQTRSRIHSSPILS